jgi:hypothetical protein
MLLFRIQLLTLLNLRIIFGYMIQEVKMPVSVNLLYDHKRNRVTPLALKWDGEVKKIKSVDLHHQYRLGRTLFHVFSVSTQGAFFRLILNTDTLFWEVDEVSDGI